MAQDEKKKKQELNDEQLKNVTGGSDEANRAGKVPWGMGRVPQL